MNLKNGDIICFLGDSITAQGMWMAETYQYLRKDYRIKCYNCGVAGGSVSNALKYVHSKCLIYNPDYVVIMFGVNDISRDLYIQDDESAEEKKKKAIEHYKSSYEKILDEIALSGAVPIICTPIPYDEINEWESKNFRCQSGLDILSEFLRDVAAQRGYEVVDFSEIIKPLVPEGKIISPDRVHPTTHGYHMMSEIFLKEIGQKDLIEPDKVFEFEPWNLERYNTEQKLHTYNFVEFALFFGEGWYLNKTVEEKKKRAMEEREKYDDKSEFIPSALMEYTELVDVYDRMRGDIVRLTIF